MTLTYWWDAPAGRLSIRCFNKSRWRLWAGDSYVGSFDTPDEAVRALSDRTLTWPAGTKATQWKAPLNLDDWHYASGRLPPNL